MDEALKTLRESKPYLFTETKPTGRTPNDGGNPQGGLTKEQFNSMSVDERTELFVNDRSTYDKLAEN